MVLSRHFKTSLVLILSGVFVSIGLLNLLDRLDWRDVSDGIRWKQTPGGLEVDTFRDLGGRVSGKLEPGDRLVSINGVPVRDLDEYIRLQELLPRSLTPERTLDYLVEKAQTNQRISYPITIRLVPKLDSTDLLLALLALAYLGIGIFVFLSNREAQGAFHFYFICLVAFILCFYRYSGRADTFDLFVYWCSAVVLLLLPSLLLHFCCHFPQSLPWIRESPHLTGLFYAPAGGLLAFHMVWFAGYLEPLGFPRIQSVSSFLDRLELLHLTTLLLLSAAVLGHAHRRQGSLVERLQTRWLTWGTTIGILPFVLFYAFPFLLGFRITPYMEISLLGLVLVPLSFAYAITKHRLTDVQLIFKQGASYLLASSALLGLYMGIVLPLSGVMRTLSHQSELILFAVVALLVAVLFSPLQNKIQRQIDRYFYLEEYDYRESLADFGKTLSSEVQLPSLVEKLLDRISSTFHVAPVALFLRERAQPGVYWLYQSRDLPEGGRERSELFIPDGLSSRFDQRLNTLSLWTQDPAVEAVRRQLAEQELHYLQPLVVHGQIIGFWALGKRRNGELLSSEDLDLIGTLSDYSAMAIDNALLYHSLEDKADQLTQLKAYSENVVESITVGVLVISPEGEITVWNDAMENLYGLERAEALGRDVSEVLSPDLVEVLLEVLPADRWTVENAVRLHKTHLLTKRGQSRLVNMTLSPFVLQGDIVTGTLIVFDDVTDKVQLESQLLQAEKLSSIGLLAAGIAHEINTPLTGICSYAQLLLKDISAGDPRRELLEKIEHQGFRASNIVDNLLKFARVRDSDLQEVNLNGLIMESLSLLDHQFRKTGVHIDLDLDPTLPHTWANGGKLQQVFMNILLNAKDAMPQGGKLGVKTTREDSQLVVIIQDSGGGISDEHIQRIYDPFFTTKEVGKGTGLGLSISYGIVQEHSGRISVESPPGKGTTFRLQLPTKRLN